MIPILRPMRRWECARACGAMETRTDAETPFHNCPAMQGLTAPLVVAGARCKVEAVVREDYVGSEQVTYDGDGRPIMAVVTTRDDGNDVAVMAPCANMDGKAGV